MTQKGTPIRITADLAIETLQFRREWQNKLKVMKGKNLKPRLLYPTRIVFSFKRENKSFTDKQKKLVSRTTKPALQEILKVLLQIGNKKAYKKKATKYIENITRPYLSTTTLNRNGLNAPIKRQRWSECIQEYTVCKKTTS